VQAAIVLGKEQAEFILTHMSTGQLHHYSRNTSNINVVGMRLNEMPKPHSANTQVTTLIRIIIIIIIIIIIPRMP